MFLDDHNLLNLAKKGRTKLRFCVGLFSKSLMKEDEIYSLEDGIDPETRAPGMPSETVSLDGFLAHKIMYIRQRPMTIRLVIGYAANAAGGVHFDPIPKAKYELLHVAAQHFQVGGLPMSIRSLQAITRVALRGIQPLIEDVEGRVVAGQS